MSANNHSEVAQPRRRKVPLWEVGLVVVTVGVLASVLLPAFASIFDYRESALERARKATCMNNLKEMAIAMQIYWNDYDGTLPSSKLVSHSKKWNKADFLTFATKVGKFPPVDTKRKTYVEVLYDYMKSKDIMFCPSDPSNHEAKNAQASYWWKLAADKAWYGDGCKPARKEADYAYNADQIILYEHNSWHYDRQDGLVNGAEINVAYMDSHVKSITLRNATSGNPRMCAANSDGEPMWYNFNFEDNVGPANERIPAKFVDPRKCGDGKMW